MRKATISTSPTKSREADRSTSSSFPAFVSNLDLGWGNPGWAHFFARLSAFSRLIMPDKRATGFIGSDGGDRNAGSAYGDDLCTVMDAPAPVVRRSWGSQGPGQ
jgi:hypothetical protein